MNTLMHDDAQVDVCFQPRTASSSTSLQQPHTASSSTSLQQPRTASSSTSLQQPHTASADTPIAYPLTTQNFVISARLGVPVDIALIAEVMHGTLDTERFPAVIIRARSPTTTHVIFSNGNVQVVGTCHLMDALLSIHQLAHRLRTLLHYPTKLHGFVVRNVVCSFSLGAFLDVAAVARDYPLRCIYNPETFEGCQFYISGGMIKGSQSTAMVLFNSGRVVITGATSKLQHIQYVKSMLPVLRKYTHNTKNFVTNAQTILDLPVMLSAVTSRFYIDCAPHAPGFYRVLQGDDDCVHTKELWQAEPLRCGECNTRATPYTFPRDTIDCEHVESWTTHQSRPLCDTCGFVDMGTGEHEIFKSHTLRKLSSSKARGKKALKADAGVPARRKRFKPDITKAVVTGLGDPRAMAEQRLRAFKKSKSEHTIE